jgi:RHS repeat-associated protein
MHLTVADLPRDHAEQGRFHISVWRKPAMLVVTVLLTICLCATSLSAQNVLVGDQTIEANLDSNATGLAEAFPVTAAASGQVQSINLFLDESSAATKIYVGIYKDASGKPGSLLTQGSTTQLFPGTWNTIPVTAASLTSGTAYWIAILGTTGGKPYFRDQSTTVCHSQTSSQSNLTSLPSTWSTGKTWNTCFISAYGVMGTLPATVLIGDQAVESNLDKNPAGQAEAFPANANTTGNVGAIALYLDPTSGSGPVYIGLYADNNGHPGTLLGQGNTASPVAGNWNQISIASSSITAGHRYWIAVLGTQATSPYFRDRQTTACRSETSHQTTLTTLPATWATGTSFSTCYISAYGLPGASSAVLSISPSSLSFGAIQGGANPAPANLSVTNTGTGTLTFIDSADTTWLSATPTSGTAPQTVQVSAVTGSLTAGTYTGHVTVTAAGALNSPAVMPVTFTVSPFVPPSITASVSPAANGNGWNDSSVTVSFVCTAGSYPVQTCTSPIPVATAGAGQVITGTVTDTNGDTNTVKVTLNIDLTPPVLTIASPANGATLTSSPASVSGTVSDALSGVASVTCNGAVATVSSGSYTCTVALTAGANTISVQATDEAGNSSAQSVSVTYSAGPGITGFSPPSAVEGTAVNVTGANFTPNGLNPVVTLSQQGGGTIVAPISSVTSGSLSFVIPSGAATGPITVTVNGQSATSSSSLTVVPSASFTLTVGPPSVSLLPGQSATVQVSLASTNGLTQLASLSVSGVPPGVTASFQPAQITAGQFSFLTLTAPAGQAPSTTALNISASAILQGIPQTQTAAVTLNVQAQSGSASFTGRVAVTDPYDTPLVGVTVSFTGTNYTGAQTGCTGSTTTDAGGNFVLNGLSSSCTGSQMIQYNPAAVISPPGKYSGVTISYVLTPGQVTTPGIIVHLPNVTNAETILISQNASTDQTFAFKSIGGLTMTVYAGTVFTLSDGTQPNPFPLSVVEIPYDRLPEQVIPDPTLDPVFAMSIEPFNSNSSQPVAITYPNRANTPPGTDMPLTSLNPTMGMMVNYGTGAVSTNGAQVIPDPDPAHPGHLYGVSHFDWFFPQPPPKPNPRNPSPDPNSPDGGDPVDISSGLLVMNKTDIAFGGSRGHVALTRTFRSGSVDNGPFGLGTSHNYNYLLDISNVSQTTGVLGLINLIMPDGNQLPFPQQPDGTYANTTIPALNGAVLTNVSTPTVAIFNLRWKDGTLFQFNGYNTFNPVTAFLASITDTNGNTMSLSRDEGVPNVLFSVTDPVGRSLNFTYNGNQISAVTDPTGRSTYYTYNPQGLLATVTDPGGGVTTYDYDSQNNLISITDGRGITYLQNTYDPNGRVIKQVAADGGVTLFNYTLLNSAVPTSPVDLTTVTDPLGNTITYHFNPQGFLADVTDALGEKTVYSLDPSSGRVLAVTDPLRRTTAYSYDAVGNTTGITHLSGTTGAVTTSLVYDPVFNKVQSITDPLGHKTTFTYDPGTGNLLSVTDALNEKTSFVYDGFGEVTTATDPLGNITHFSYANGNPVQITDPLGRTIAKTYDAISRLISASNALGQTTSYLFSPLNQVAQIVDPAGNRTLLSYDRNGNLIQVTDANGHTTTHTYDVMDRLFSRTDPLGKTETNLFDLDGNLVQFTDRRGKVTKYGYDRLNRRTSSNFGPGESSISYSYDAGMRLAQVVDSVTGTISRNYDGLDRLISDTTAQGNISYGFDAAGRRTSMQVSGQGPVSYAYDNADRLVQIAQGASIASFVYDNDGRRTVLNLPNGTTTSYGYDAASQLISVSYQFGATSQGNLTYSYDLAGRRVSIGGTLAQSNLPTALSSASYNANNQLTQWGAKNLSYDGNGNLTSDGVNSYSWNARNQLISVNGTVSAGFSYDSFGRRAAKSLNASTTNYLYDGLNSVQELAGGLSSASILTGLVADENLQRSDASGTASFLTDALGNTLLLAGATGNTLAQYTYDPFGNTSMTGSSANPAQYTGRENDGTSLYYYRARYYSPAYGRFISEDPYGLRAGPNLYAYANNDPVDLIDPMGLFSSDVHYQLSYDAAVAAGFSPSEADQIATECVMADFAPNSQDTDAFDANLHAMSGRKPNGKYQNCNQAVQGTADRLGGSLLANELGPALHTVQDAQAGGHKFQEWHGGMPSLSHEIQDFMPSPETYQTAFDNSVQLLKDYRNNSVAKDLTTYLKGKGPLCGFGGGGGGAW